jgi:hypothetical protein
MARAGINVQALQQDSGNRSFYGDYDTGLSSRQSSLVKHLRTFFIGRLFKMNHILLDVQAVNEKFFILLILLEYCQMTYFAFNNTQVVNEFVNRRPIPQQTVI